MPQYISVEEHERLLRRAVDEAMGTPMDKDDEDHPAWLELKKMHDRGDFATIERIVKFWKGLEAVGAIGGLLKVLIIWIGVMAGGFYALHTAFGDYIKGIVR